ncbi:MAG: hypothetical protein KAR21_06400 [Spirochaetales bacterium]|nr:hypothetical protein [Spirochaetales bacterium]
MRLISIATEYHLEDAYPVFVRQLPESEEIKEIIDFIEPLFNRVCNELEIDLSEIVDS